MNTSICDRETMLVAAIPRVAKVTMVLPAVMLSTAPLPFPEVFIVARGLRRTMKCNLEAMPPLAFDAWIKVQAEDALLIAAILDIDRSRWSIEEKWRVINELHLRGVDLPLYSPIEAEMEVQRGQ